MASPKVIRDQIISILISGNPLNAKGKSIVKWFKGEPPRSRYPGFPWGWVEWAGGTMSPPVGAKAEVKDNFFVVVVDKHINPEEAEDSIMDFTESVETVLDDSPSLNGTVATSYIINREKEKLFEGDYSIVAVRITLSTRRRE